MVATLAVTVGQDKLPRRTWLLLGSPVMMLSLLALAASFTLAPPAAAANASAAGPNASAHGHEDSTPGMARARALSANRIDRCAADRVQRRHHVVVSLPCRGRVWRR